MIPAAFGYARPASLDEALADLSRQGSSTKILAGGQSLLPLMKLRLARPERLLDIGWLRELRGVRKGSDGRTIVGAMTTYHQLMGERSVMVLAAMGDVLPRIADLQVRNRGTIGGAVAHADPAGEITAVLLALEAELAVRSTRGERTMSVADCLTGPFTTSLAPDELITEIRLPAPSGSHGSAYRAIDQPASGYALAGVAAVVGWKSGAGSGPFDDCRVAITGVGEIPYRAAAVESAILGGATPAEAAAHATDGVTVASDIHADSTYRAAMAAVHARRALEAAIARVS